jgi:ATP-dependent RNA helicase UAP56/SUB2
MTPHEKASHVVLSTTLSKEIPSRLSQICQDPMEIYADDETKLTFARIQLYYCKCPKPKRTANSTICSIRSIQPGRYFRQQVAGTQSPLARLQLFPVSAFTVDKKQEERIEKSKSFKDFNARISSPRTCSAAELILNASTWSSIRLS